MAATEPIRSKKHLKKLADYFLARQEYRNHALVILGTYTALRISDLLQIKWADVYDEERQAYHTHLTVCEKKTKKTKVIALNKEAPHALQLCRPYKRNSFVFASNRDDKPISREQAWRIVKTAVNDIGIEGKIACHSFRKSWGYHAWTSGKVSPVVIMDVLNHSSYDMTRRYLGITQDDLDKAYLGMGLF